MRKARLAPRGRIRASEESLAKEAARQMGIAHHKQGQLGELAFLYKATNLGFALSLPYGHLQHYDFVVEGGGRLWRVQVKSATCLEDGLYHVGIRHITNRRPTAYTASEIDFVAVYIIPDKTWYVLPVREVEGRQTLWFRPKRYRHLDRYAHYREAWHLLREPDGLVFG